MATKHRSDTKALKSYGNAHCREKSNITGQFDREPAPRPRMARCQPRGSPQPRMAEAWGRQAWREGRGLGPEHLEWEGAEVGKGLYPERLGWPRTKLPSSLFCLGLNWPLQQPPLGPGGRGRGSVLLVLCSKDDPSSSPGYTGSQGTQDSDLGIVINCVAQGESLNVFGAQFPQP